MSTPIRLDPESNQIFKSLLGNSGSFIQLEATIDGNSEYMLKEIDIIQGQLESTPYTTQLGQFIKEITDKKKFEQRINTPSDLGGLYYIELAEYNKIKTNNPTVANISIIEPKLNDHRIDSVSYIPLAYSFRDSGQRKEIRSLKENNGTLKPVKKATATLTSEQTSNINDFNNQLQAMITNFNKLNADRRSAYDTANVASPSDAEKNSYVDAHQKAIILYEVCKELVDRYNALLKALRGKVDILKLDQQTDITLANFDVYTPIIPL
jgi:hypothetical protein